MKDDDDKLTIAINMRVSADDASRLDAVAERIRIGTRHGIARAALRLGLTMLEEDPSRLLSAPVEATGNADRRARRRK